MSGNSFTVEGSLDTKVSGLLGSGLRFHYSMYLISHASANCFNHLCFVGLVTLVAFRKVHALTCMGVHARVPRYRCGCVYLDEVESIFVCVCKIMHETVNIKVRLWMMS